MPQGVPAHGQADALMGDAMDRMDHPWARPRPDRGRFAAWWKLGRSAALDIAFVACLGCAYVVGSHQASVAAAAETLRREKADLEATLAVERAQAAAAARIATADATRAVAAEETNRAGAARLQELERALSNRPARACIDDGTARRLRAL